MASCFNSKNIQAILYLMAILVFTSCQTESNIKSGDQSMKLNYPDTRKDNSVEDNYHGNIIKDPYRWLEDDNSVETKDWVTEQNKVTFGYLEQIPFRKVVRDRLEELWNYERFSTPFKRGKEQYIFRNDGLQNQAVLYRVESDGNLTEILNPNNFSEDGTSSLGSFSFSKNGHFLAYEISTGGSDWRKVKVLNLQNQQTLPDELDWLKFSGISWQGDGFYYSRYPAPEEGDELSARNVNHKLYFHQLGDKQEQDKLIHEENSNPNIGIGASTSEDERFVSLGLWESTSGNALYVIDNEQGGKKIPIYRTIEADFNFVDNLGDELLIMTNYKADNNRLVVVNAKNPAEKNWRTLLPESTDKLSSVHLLGGKIFATYTHNASSLVKVFDIKGNHIQDLALPGIGTIGGFSGKQSEQQAFYAYTSFTQPTAIYELDVNTLKSKIYKAPNTDFDSDKFETNQVWFESKDGTKVPMFVTHKKGLKLDGTNPTLLYGYGGFNISIPPAYSVQRAVLLESGGIFAVANIRGGGEFGKKWHKQGTLDQKQNVFDDFQAAAEYLIEKKYTSPAKLAIEGGSNGGLLVGACMTQRPDLYAVAFPRVGVLDMLRYDKFTIGRAWSTDYGLSEEPEAFEYLKAYSPLHNLKEVSYPATMIATADHDDRVVPAHSFKFAAALQSFQQGNNPALIRIETSAGHGAGKPTSKQIDEAADFTSFMFFNMKETISYP